MEGDVNTLLEQATKMVDMTCETAPQLHARLLEAAAAIDEEELKEEPKGEKQKESVETERTPGMMASFLPGKQHVPYLSPTQTAHYAKEKPNEHDEVTYEPTLMSHKPESLNRPRPGHTVKVKEFLKESRISDVGRRETGQSILAECFQPHTRICDYGKDSRPL